MRGSLQDKPAKPRPLTPKEQRFVEEYLVDLNASAAYRRAGYRGKHPNVHGPRMVAKSSIAAAVSEARAKLAEKARVTVEMIVERYKLLAFGDPRKVATWGPGGVMLRDSATLTDEEAALIASVNETPAGVGFKLHSSTAALDSLAKHLGMFVEKHEHSGPGGKDLLPPGLTVIVRPTPPQPLPPDGPAA